MSYIFNIQHWAQKAKFINLQKYLFRKHIDILVKKKSIFSIVIVTELLFHNIDMMEWWFYN